MFPTLAFGQNKNSKFEFLPEGIHFMPLKAGADEAKMGVLYFPDNGNLKLDIGNSVDLLQFRFDADNKLSFGIEFMAYALSTNHSGLKLQIDAIDGFFGGNAIYSHKLSASTLFLRFRAIHNSAHLVDGHYDFSTGNFINGDAPIPFTRDFGELIISHLTWIKQMNLRYYGGFLYAVKVRPDTLKRYSFSAGAELNYKNIFGKLFEKDINLFAAYHFNLTGISKFHGNNNFQFGIKFGNWLGKGIVFYLSYYSGLNYFHEYYLNKIKKFGFGFSIDFY